MNIKVGIVDTGCFMHDFFKDKNINIIGDNVGHGSKLASIVLQINSKVEIINYNAEYRNKIKINKVIEGIEFLIKKQVDIILLSLGSITDNEELHKVIKKAHRKKIYIFCASGNLPKVNFYPSCYKEVISVGSLTEGRKSRFSADADIYFQGKNVNVVWKNNSFTKDDGTSYANAKGVGYATLILENLEIKPNKDELIELLKEVNEFGF